MKLPTSFQRFSPLQIALGISIAVHAVLLTVRFVDPERFERVFQDTPLEVILVNARPKKRYISPATKEAVYAVYYDALRRKVEDKGTENFPENKGKKLYGELVMILTVNYDGRVVSTEVVQSSGTRMLDTRAEAIARAAGPYGHFGPAMRAKADQIAVVSRFRFTREHTLETDVR